MFVLFLQLAVGLRFAVDKIADIIVSAPVSGCTRGHQFLLIHLQLLMQLQSLVRLYDCLSQNRVSTRVSVLVCSMDVSDDSLMDRMLIANLLWAAQIPVRMCQASNCG